MQLCFVSLKIIHDVTYEKIENEINCSHYFIHKCIKVKIIENKTGSSIMEISLH